MSLFDGDGEPVLEVGPELAAPVTSTLPTRAAGPASTRTRARAARSWWPERWGWGAAS